MIQVFLDDIQYDDPLDWTNLESTLKRDEELDVLLVYQSGSLTFDGAAYDYILSKIEELSFNGFIRINVFSIGTDGDPLQIVKGRLFLSDVEIDEYNYTVTCKITDDSFNATINNNKSIKATVSAPRSKNDTEIYAADMYELEIYDPPSNVTYNRVYSVRVHDAFKMLTQFMTDGNMDFVSDTFDIGGEWEGLCITNGIKIRTNDNTGVPTLTPFSFLELYQEIKKRIPIGMIIENPYTIPRLRIEALEYFYQGATTTQFTDIERITTRFDTNKLYSKVKLGTSETDNDVTLAFPEDIVFRGFNEEEFHVLGTSNIDRALELQCDWVTSSNVIEKCFNGDESYDKNLFLIDSTLTSSVYGVATPTNFLGLSPAQYYPNERLTNDNIANRYLGSIPNSIAQYFEESVGDGEFKAILSNPISDIGSDTYNPFAFDTEIYDNSGAYNPATFRYTAPESGVYIMQCNMNVTITVSQAQSIVRWQLEFIVYDSTGTEKYRKFAYLGNVIVSGVQWLSLSQMGTFNMGMLEVPCIMNDGDYCVVNFIKDDIEFGNVEYTINGGGLTYFKCESTSLDAGGIYEIYDPKDYQVQQHEFAYKMTNTDFLNILATSRSSFPFYRDADIVRFAWVSEIKYNHYTGLAQCKLITDKNSENNGNRIST